MAVCLGLHLYGLTLSIVAIDIKLGSDSGVPALNQRYFTNNRECMTLESLLEQPALGFWKRQSSDRSVITPQLKPLLYVEHESPSLRKGYTQSLFFSKLSPSPVPEPGDHWVLSESHLTLFAIFGWDIYVKIHVSWLTMLMQSWKCPMNASRVYSKIDSSISASEKPFSCKRNDERYQRGHS